MRSASGRSAACLSGGSRDGKRDILGSLSKSELGMRTYSTTDDGNALISGGGCETLALGFVEDDGGGDGGVEGFDGAGHGNGESGVGGALNFGGEAGAFVADEEGEGGAEVGGVGGGRGGFGGGGDEREAGGAELGESNRWREAAEERRRRAEPAEARMALADQGSAVPLVVTTPVAPKASAERMAAPTLPGSWTPNRATMRGRPRVRSSRVHSRGFTRA